MTGYDAISGIGSMRFTAFVATDAVRIGESQDTAEASRLEWIPLAGIPNLEIWRPLHRGN